MGDSSNIERMTVSVTPEMALAMRTALDEGEYASSSEIVREALRDWQHKRRLQQSELAALRADIAIGDRDMEAGRTVPFDVDRIVQKGREKLRRR